MGEQPGEPGKHTHTPVGQIERHLGKLSDNLRVTESVLQIQVFMAENVSFAPVLMSELLHFDGWMDSHGAKP